MRTMFMLLIAALPLCAFAQDEGYHMYETITLVPDNANIPKLSDALAEHNKTFHSEGPHSAIVWQISTGPNSGKLVWMMGPCTFTDLDSRPAGEHDEHWATAVMPYIKRTSTAEYWRRDDDLSNTNGDPRPIVAIRYLEVDRGQGYRTQGLLKKISEAVKASDDDSPWSIYYNEFRQGNDIGRHIALVSGLASWSEFDKPDTFRADYEKAHGEGTWNAFLREWNDVFSNSWDEMWTLMPELSGPSND